MLQERIKSIAKVVGIILIFCIVGVGILCLDRVLTPKKSPAETFESAKQKLMAAKFDGEIYMRKNVVTYLISGVDKYDGEGDTDGAYRNFKHADFNLLLIIDGSDRTITAINVNRDTIVEQDELGMGGMRAGTVDQQLALAHTYGDGKQQSGENLRRAVVRLFSDRVENDGNVIDQYSITIDHYITMTMEAVSALNDYLGGVTVTLTEDLSSESHPDWTEGATVTIHGTDAEFFVRARMDVSDGTNVSRMGRQNLYIEALFKTIGNKKWDYRYLYNAYEAIKDYTVTDYSNFEDLLSDFEYLFTAFGMYQYNKTISLNNEYGTSEVVDGVMAYFADREKIKELVKTYFYREINEKERND